MGVVAAGETPKLTREFSGETHRVLERTQTHTPGNQHQKGPIYLWVAGEVTESQLREPSKHECSISDPSPTYKATVQRTLAKETDFLPGSSESPKEVGPKEAHTKVHPNYITQD